MAKPFLFATLACLTLGVAAAQAQYYEVPPTEFTGPLSNLRYEDCGRPLLELLSWKQPRMPYADDQDQVIEVPPRMPLADEDETGLWGLEQGLVKQWTPKQQIDQNALGRRFTILRAAPDLTRITISWCGCWVGHVCNYPDQEDETVSVDCQTLTKWLPWFEGVWPIADPRVAESFVSCIVSGRDLAGHTYWTDGRWREESLLDSLAFFGLPRLIVPEEPAVRAKACLQEKRDNEDMLELLRFSFMWVSSFETLLKAWEIGQSAKNERQQIFQFWVSHFR